MRTQLVVFRGSWVAVDEQRVEMRQTRLIVRTRRKWNRRKYGGREGDKKTAKSNTVPQWKGVNLCLTPRCTRRESSATILNKEYRRWVGSTRKKQADFEDSFILTLVLVLLQADVAWLTKDDGQVSEKKRATQTHHWSTPNIFLDSPHGSTLSSFGQRDQLVQ